MRCCVGLVVCRAAAVRLVRQRGRLVRRDEAGARLRGVDGDGGVWTSRSERVGCEEGVVAVLVLVLLWQQASEAGGRVEL